MNACTPAIAIDRVQFCYGRPGPRRRDTLLAFRGGGRYPLPFRAFGLRQDDAREPHHGRGCTHLRHRARTRRRGPFRTARARIGFMPQDDALYEDVTAEENLRFFAALYGVKGEHLARRMDELFAFVRLQRHRKKLVHDYSGGMKRRLSLAVALVHEPAVLVLDEPTVGLDPEHRRYIWNHLEALAAQGCAIVVTTHVMDEAERCARIAMIREGQLIADASPADILARTGTNTLEDAFLALEESESPDTAAEPNVSPSLGEKEACHD